jgi:outer membrane protein OmpA-like peptidoglycan-associated protein
MARNTFIYIALFLLLAWNHAFSQKKGKGNYKVADRIALDSNVNEQQAHKPEIKYQFHNVNHLFYYENQAHKAKIKKLEDDKDFVNLLPELRAYVLNFGIRNFYTEPELIWKVAQLSEMMGLNDDALYFYRLVLKHYRGKIDVDKVKLNYDTLAQNVDDKYVPLKFYYELVEYRKAVDTLRPPRGVFLKLDDAINSKSEDYAPSLNLESNLMIFSSRRKKNHNISNTQLNEDIYMAKSYEGIWDEAKFMEEINTPYNEGSACITRDGKTMIFSRCMAPGGLGNCDLYLTRLNEEGHWSKPKNLGTSINSVAWDSQPSLSHNEDTLYFASDRIGGFGLSDIYFSLRMPDGSWSSAKNIGPIINTRENEVSPFMHPLYNVLYFSSTGHMLRFGDFDIFKSRKVDGVWTEPKSIGPLVNGVGSEYYFTIDSDSKNLYYARAEGGSKDLDIYSFPLPMEAQPNAIVNLKGSLTDSISGNPYKGIVTVIDMTNGIEVAPKELRPDGSYSFDLIDDADYLLVIQGEDFFRIEQKIKMSGDTTVQIKVPPIKFKSIQFTTVNFENDKADILPVMHGDLDKIFNYMLDNPDVKLVISGHTDKQGDPKKNIDLSQRRADAIKKYLLKNNLIEENRITAIGYGSSKPIKEEVTMEDKTLNRRVEFQIIRDNE